MLALPFFFTGMYFKEYILKFIEHKHNFILSSAFFCITAILLCVNKQPSYTGLSFGALPIPFNALFFYLAGLSGTFMTMFLFEKTKQNKLIENLSKALISIVGIQALFYKCIVFSFGREHNLWAYMLIGIGITALCCLFHYFIEKHIPFVLGKTKQKV